MRTSIPDCVFSPIFKQFSFPTYSFHCTRFLSNSAVVLISFLLASLLARSHMIFQQYSACFKCFFSIRPMDIKTEKVRSQILSGGRTSLKMKVSLTGIKTDAVTDAFFAREKGDKEVRPWDRSKHSPSRKFQMRFGWC